MQEIIIKTYIAKYFYTNEVNNLMPTIPYLKQKIGQAYLIWYQLSNQYILLEEPAWFVFRKIVKRFKTETIALEFESRYDIAYNDSLLFVKDIRSGIKKIGRKDNNPNDLDKITADLKMHLFSPFSTHHYKIGNQVIAFYFENFIFEQYLHPLISHFETDETNCEMTVFELFSWEGQIVFRFDGKVKGIWTKDETHLVKGLIFMFLINVMHHKTDADWLMTVHASAITNGKKTILFSAPPNHGKTTIAALLQSRGYQLISDDFVPIDRDSFCAFPFPIAMSVKQNSMDLLASVFPGLEEKKLTYISPGKSVRYLSPHPFDVSKAIFPVREFVFVEYNHSVDFNLEKLDPIKAIKLLLDQAWVSPEKGNAAILFERIQQVSFFKLTYSNNNKALDAIINLFDND